MLGRLLLLFTLVPLVEVYLLVTLGGLLGPAATVGLVLVTGAVGAFLARHEGSRVLREWQSSVAQGELPEEGVVSSVLVLVGGVLLVTPGVLTDIVGLSLLIPPSRKAIAKVVKRRLEAKMEVRTLSGADADVIDPFLGGLGAGRSTRTGDRERHGEVVDVEAHPTREQAHRDRSA